MNRLPDQRTEENDRLLVTEEIAKLFRVEPKTVVRWIKAGRLDAVRTPGGHLRCRESVVQAALRQALAADASPIIKPRPCPPYNEHAGMTSGEQIMRHRLDILADVHAELVALLAELDRYQCGAGLRERLTAMHEHIARDGDTLASYSARALEVSA
ncbi:helix-turn-helix domain-containing protein [Actinomadura sp. 6N118]|uniref:helix-turn-helix domain-containing protein n=1 Tax=Actinomadura sp. 6N118 TaxID=3375151 RepID=UPI0037AC5234